MKTSAFDTEHIDRYLLQQLPPGDKLVFDARLMLCPQLQETVEWQRKVHYIVKLRGRQQLKAQIQAAEQMVFSQPEYNGFRQKVLRWFGK
jgi:NAD(P)H-dependent FMN reductase